MVGALAALPVGAVSAETARLFVVGPVPIMPSADLIIHALSGRLAALGLSSTVRQVGTALEYTVIGDAAPELVIEALTRPGQFSLHAVRGEVTACEDGDASCLPGPEGTAYQVDPDRLLTGDRLAGAEAVADPVGGQALSISFDAKGARRLAEITAARIDEQLAFVLDGVVVMAPRIKTAIPSGTAIISGASLDAALWAAILGQPAMPEALILFEVKDLTQ